jgi:hypothetical protein
MSVNRVPGLSRRHPARLARACAAGVLLVAPLLPATASAAPRAAAPAAPSVWGPLVTRSLADGLTPAEIAAQLAGPGVTVSNVSYRGAATAGGTFVGGTGLGLPAGALLSTGEVAAAAGPNTVGDRSTEHGTPGDAHLDALVSSAATRDAAVLEFDLVPQGSRLSLPYVFASEEYDELVADPAHDVVAVLVNGANCARVPGGDPVSVRTVNAGSHPQLFRDNATGFIDSEFDGFTTTMTCVADVRPGEVNRIKLAVADVRDARFDSTVFLPAGGLAATVPTRVTPVGATGGQYSDPVSVGGRLERLQPTVTPVAGARLRLTLGDRSATTGRTDASGTATATLPLMARPGTAGLTVSYRGDGDLRASTATARLRVAREDCRLTATAPAAGVAGSAVPVSVRFREPDDTPGDLAGKAVQVRFASAAGGTPATASVATSPTGTGATAARLAAGTYTVTASFPGDRLHEPCAAPAARITVAPAPAASIDSAGPLLRIATGSDLTCAVTHRDDPSGSFGGCGTFLAVDGRLYGPAAVPDGDAAAPRTPWTVVSPPTRSGSGTAADPYRITTTVAAGSSGVQLRQTDSYVVGRDDYRTDLRVVNGAGRSLPVLLYRAADCRLQNSDRGFGLLGFPTGAVACLGAVDPAADSRRPGGRIVQWLPLTAGSGVLQGTPEEVFGAVASRRAFPGSCRCADDIDHAAGLSWAGDVPAGGEVARAHATRIAALTAPTPPPTTPPPTTPPPTTPPPTTPPPTTQPPATQPPTTGPPAPGPGFVPPAPGPDPTFDPTPAPPLESGSTGSLSGLDPEAGVGTGPGFGSGTGPGVPTLGDEVPATEAAPAAVRPPAPLPPAPPPPRGLRLDPPFVLPGGSTVVSGEGCPPGTTVTFLVDGVPAGTIAAGRDGRFTGEVPIPVGLEVGRHTVSATCSGGGSASLPLDLVVTTSTAGIAGATAITGSMMVAFFVLLGFLLSHSRRLPRPEAALP